MSSTEHSRDPMGRRKINPVTAEEEELITALGADPVNGLSVKEAERRLAKSTAKPLFTNPPRSFRECLLQNLREPAFWMLLALSLMALVFDRILLGGFCALLTAGNAIFCALLLYRAERIESTMAVYDQPLCRVLRGRRILRLSADRLVTGDIILLYPGDIVPADCRLLRAHGLTVLERELDASSAASIRLSKSTDTPPTASGSLRVSPSNMVFAGGIVEEGDGLALVVAVGSATHLGGMKGSLPSEKRSLAPDSFRKVARVLSLLNLGFFCLAVPLTAVGIFTLGDRYEFLDIFLSALSLATVMLTEHMLAKSCYAASALRRDAAVDRDRESTADIRSTAVCEKLTVMTDLLLVGTAALHDGLSHPETLRIGELTYRCDRPESDDESRAVAEYLYLYHRARLSLPTEAGTSFAASRYIPALCEWAEIDTDGLLARVDTLRPVGVNTAEVTFNAAAPLRLHLTERFREAEACEQIYTPEGILPVDGDVRSKLYRAYRETFRQGSRVAFLLVEESGHCVLRGMLTYAPHSDRRAASCVRGLEKAGIRVTALLRESGPLCTRGLAACGLTDTAEADAPPAEGARIPAAIRIGEGCRAFVGCDEAFLTACIRDLKAEGRTVGLLSVDRRDLDLLAEADVAFTCVPSLYMAAETSFYRAERPATGDGDPDGLPDGRIADDRARRTAHVLVRRSSADGGGVLGVRHALLTADRCRDTLERSMGLLILFQTVRLLATALPLCLGVTLTAAPMLLLSGLLMDLLFMATCFALPLGDLPAPRKGGAVTLRSLWLTFRAELIAAAVAVAVPWIAVGIAILSGASLGGDPTLLAMLCLPALQILIFRLSALPRRNRNVFLATLGCVLAYVGTMGAALAAGLSPVWAFLLPPTAAALYPLTRLILRRGLSGKGASH